jgi:hypothetical protein
MFVKLLACAKLLMKKAQKDAIMCVLLFVINREPLDGLMTKSAMEVMAFEPIPKLTYSMEQSPS